jgi:hypothetical protein
MLPLLSFPPDPFRPTWSRGLFAVVVAAGAFLLPQEAPLVFYPLNDPSRGVLQLQITCQASTESSTQIFYDLGQGFNEFHSIRWPIAPSRQPYTYTFPLPDAPLRGLRLDPLGKPGTLIITNLRILERRGGEIRRFTRESFLRPGVEIAAVTPTANGWEVVTTPGAADPQCYLEFGAPIIPEGMNGRNLQRCLLSWSYLAMMLWILLLAVYFVLVRDGSLRKIARTAVFMAGVALLFSLVGNRSLIKDSIRYARFHPPPVKPGLSLEIDLTVDHPSLAQLFWDTGAGFNEKESLVRNYEPHGQLQTLRLPLPRGSIRGLRFDPLLAEGQLDIRGIRIVDESRKTRRIVPFTTLRAAREIAAIEIGEDQAVIRTTPGATDPILEFDADEVKVIAGLIAREMEREKP